MEEEQQIIFQSHPVVTIGTNRFHNVPTILQFEDTPLLEVGKFVEAGYTTQFPVYHSDGTKIAVVKGSQIYLTREGAKANIALRHPQGMTVCELEGKTILELRREGPAAVRGAAELYAPEGTFIKANTYEASALLRGGRLLNSPGFAMSNSDLRDFKIGILVKRDSVSIGVGGGSAHFGFLQVGGTPQGQ